MDSPSLSLSAEYRTKLCFFFKKKSHQPKCGSQWWVIIISLVCFQWSLPAKIRRQTGAGWGVTKGFDLNQGIFFPHYLNWKHLVEFLFLSFFLFFFFFLWFDCYQFNYQDTLWASKQTHPKNLHVLLRTQTRVRAGGSSGEGHKCSRRASCNTDYYFTSWNPCSGTHLPHWAIYQAISPSPQLRQVHVLKVYYNNYIVRLKGNFLPPRSTFFL